MSKINFRASVTYLIILVIYTCATLSAQAQHFYFTGNKSKDAIGFDLVKNLIIVPLYLNGKGPFNFILDTGVGPLIITDAALIDSVGINIARSIKISGLGKGDEIDAFLSNDLSAKIGDAHIDHIPTAILKNDIFGLSNYLGTRIYGLLGYYFFNSFIVEVKYSTKRLLFSDPGAKIKIKGEGIPIVIDSYKPYIKINIESPEHGKLDLKTLVDNGASHALSLERLNEQPFPVPANTIPGNLGVGMSGPIDGNIGRVSLLKIGDYTLKNVLVSYPKYDDVAAKILLKNRNGNLGADVLSRFNIVFDYSRNFMYLKRNSQFNRPFDHDMSGIELYADDDGKTNRYLVSRIEPGSPAQQADIQVDDEILLINFVPVSSYKLNELNNLLKSVDGKTIILYLQRNKEQLVKVFKLKRRI
ncbi:aspartyl protease family protein [Pedobacter nyackensis]|uniref:PDZ domain (Also known as DHR or GLGF) n=1 Tax=Pedobacter nyackensis TaxID=475255 RepID=A0A1W2BPY5_9SPHI|nr:aspartyl protease family protein [Pedobacter nyackensis]SMC74628.1 PDZ domain (Also known as DHR or GLGF) [Pedobacter nyackensis]